MKTLSPEYEAAYTASVQAGEKYDCAVAAYRAREISDVAFCAAWLEHRAAQKVFDIAYAREAGWLVNE